MCTVHTCLFQISLLLELATLLFLGCPRFQARLLHAKCKRPRASSVSLQFHCNFGLWEELTFNQTVEFCNFGEGFLFVFYLFTLFLWGFCDFFSFCLFVFKVSVSVVGRTCVLWWWRRRKEQFL